MLYIYIDRYIDVCVCVCLYVRAIVCMHVCMYESRMHVCMHVRTYVSMHECEHAYASRTQNDRTKCHEHRDGEATAYNPKLQNRQSLQISKQAKHLLGQCVAWPKCLSSGRLLRSTCEGFGGAPVEVSSSLVSRILQRMPKIPKPQHSETPQPKPKAL